MKYTRKGGLFPLLCRDSPGKYLCGNNMLSELETFVALADQRGHLTFGSKKCQHQVVLFHKMLNTVLFYPIVLSKKEKGITIVA